MDYESEQQMEIEALQAILMDELEEYEGMLSQEWSQKMVGKCYKVIIRPNEEDLGKIDFDVRMDLVFVQTKQYPESEPLISIKGTRGLNQKLQDECYDLLKKEIEANLGISMIYQLITVAKDWISTKVEEFGDTGEETEQEKRKKLDKIEEERALKRRYGTQVTEQTFMEWRQNFQQELISQKTQAQLVAQEKEQTKLSGKQIFMQQYKQNEEEDLEGSDIEDDTNKNDTIIQNELDQQNGQLLEDQEEVSDDDIAEDDEDFLEDFLAQKGQT